MAKVEQRAYHGEIDPLAMAEALALQFDSGTTRSRWVKLRDGGATVQVWTPRVETDDPVLTLTLRITPTPTGIVATMSEEHLLGVGADLAKTGLKALLRPITLLTELDDVARNLRKFRLHDELWAAVESYCRLHGSAGKATLSHVICPYCGTPNPVGRLTCSACQAPLVEVQPIACPRCGFLNDPENERCTQCGALLKGARQR